MMAKLQCPLCPAGSLITCRPEKSGLWKISNFVAHIKNVHKFVSEETTETRKRPTVEQKASARSENSEENAEPSSSKFVKLTLPEVRYDVQSETTVLENSPETLQEESVQVIDCNSHSIIANSSKADWSDDNSKDPLAVSQVNGEAFDLIIEEIDATGFEQLLSDSEVRSESEEVVEETMSEDLLSKSNNDMQSRVLNL